MVLKEIFLPEPKQKGDISLEEAIAIRRSIRKFKDEPITHEKVSQILWAAQGITDTVNKFRAVPSAGALFPLEVYITARKVEDLPSGIYKYEPNGHKLFLIKEGDVTAKLVREALWQDWIAKSSIVVIISAVFERTMAKYGKRGIQYVYLEAGHCAQNICLQAVALGLGTAPVGAFNDEGIQKIIGMQESEVPLYILPIGVQE